MTSELTADEVRSLLKLEPNATCGFVRLTFFLSNRSIGAGGLAAPFEDGRPLGSALYFMVTPDAPVRLHRIRNDQARRSIAARGNGRRFHLGRRPAAPGEIGAEAS
jgi:predicted cupin superfamily sugar epimerase